MSRPAEGLRQRGGECKEWHAATPLISVITVVYNGERHLEQTILSVINQGYGNVEYIIIDGGSTDGTLGIIEKYADRIACRISEPDSGIYDAMNKGIALARGELIGLLNADDFYEPDALQSIAQAYLGAPCRGIYYGNHFMLQEDLGLRYKSYASLRYWLGMPICHQAMFVHRAVYQDIGAYSLAYRFAADYEFLLRTVTAQVPYRHVDAFLLSYRNCGLTSTYYTASLHEAKLINRWYFTAFSVFHAKFLASYYKTVILFFAQKVIGALLGKKVLDRARLWYMKTFIAKDGAEDA